MRQVRQWWLFSGNLPARFWCFYYNSNVDGFSIFWNILVDNRYLSLFEFWLFRLCYNSKNLNSIGALSFVEDLATCDAFWAVILVTSEKEMQWQEVYLIVIFPLTWANLISMNTMISRKSIICSSALVLYFSLRWTNFFSLALFFPLFQRFEIFLTFSRLVLFFTHSAQTEFMEHWFAKELEGSGNLSETKWEIHTG